EETDESLRERYYESLRALAFGGNVADYRAKTEKIPGVGACKVFPAWSGGGTVKLAITDGTGGVPTEELVQQVQQEIDPPGLSGQGRGWAPVGHAVTVEGVIGVTVNIEFKLILEQGYTWESVKANVTAALQMYFEDMVKGWADVESITVRTRQLEAKVLTVNGVLDIADTKLNGVAGNLVLASTEIPLLGAVTNRA
ncbi:baseplate J/gp47 family protein, partial [Paenibacillus popilliae]